MRCPLSAERAASEELAAAVRWYEAQRQGLGAEFLDAVLETLNKVAERPRAGTALPGRMNIRRMLVDRFPYQVVSLRRGEGPRDRGRAPQETPGLLEASRLNRGGHPKLKISMIVSVN